MNSAPPASSVVLPKLELPKEQPVLSSTEAIALPRLVLRIGLIGNRQAAGPVPVDHPNVRTCVRKFLHQLADATVAAQKQCQYCSQEPPVLRFVTGLASGSDQVLTQEAFSSAITAPIARELFVIYPYDITTYQAVNPITSGLPSRADWALVLDPSAPAEAERQRSYQAQAWWIRQHSDLLVAIWDPANRFNPGGTEDSIQHALRQGLPVIWVQPSQQPCIRILRQPEQINPGTCPTATTGDIQKLLQQLLAFPRPRAGSHEAGTAHHFEAEIQEFFNPPLSGDTYRGSLWRAGLEILNGMFELQQSSLRCWRESQNQPVRPVRAARRMNSPAPPQLRPYAGWKNRADQLAGFYAGQYRGGFMLNHLLAWIAVFCASFGLFVVAFVEQQQSKYFFGLLLSVVELIAIAWIVGNVRSSKAGRWHEKSINYRYLAELLRQMDFLAALACSTPSSRPPIQYAGNDPRQTWMTWLFHALVRQAPPMITSRGAWRCKTLGASHCDAVLDDVRKNWISGQIEHHRQNSTGMGRMQETIEFWSRCFFYFVLACGLVHVLFDVFFHDPNLHSVPLLVQCCLIVSIILPAAVITLIGFRNQTEARRLHERSWNMSLQLVRLSRDLLRMKNSRGPSTPMYAWQVAAGVHALGQVMIDEVTDWQIVYRMHEISEA